MHIYACTDRHLLNSPAYVRSHELTHTLFLKLLPPPNHSRTCVHTNTPTSTTTQTTTFTPYTHTITTTQTTYTHTHIIAQPSTHQYQGDRELGTSACTWNLFYLKEIQKINTDLAVLHALSQSSPLGFIRSHMLHMRHACCLTYCLVSLSFEHAVTKCNCNTLQRSAAHCSALQHTATHYDTLPHIASHYRTLHHTAPHCNASHRTATRSNTLQQTTTPCITLRHPAPHGTTLQHTAPHCNAPQFTATG